MFGVLQNFSCIYSNLKNKLYMILSKIILLLRPQQWVKNAFIFLPLFFHGDLTNVEKVVNAVIAFFCYSFAASGIYCFNDIYDVEADRKHPKKCKRPIASGAVSIPQAYCLMALMLFLSLNLAFWSLGNVSLNVIGVICFYFLMNIFYCVKLKQIALVDVFIIAIGFVLRIILGGVVNEIELSQWIVLMTFLLALFLAFAKRRDDVVLYQETGVLPRKNVNRYNLDFMNQAISIVGTITLVAYIMYTVSDEVMSRLGSRYIYFTTIFVLAGILRYMQLTIVDVKSGSPTKVLMKDKFVQLCIIGWVLAFLILIYL